nr:hypothetical protein Itr_chr14CG00520 [Ipomoea trifida]GLL45468.1 hypothetical protein Itr_chr14CG00530 [Ipomoea trifida]
MVIISLRLLGSPEYPFRGGRRRGIMVRLLLLCSREVSLQTLQETGWVSWKMMRMIGMIVLALGKGGFGHFSTTQHPRKLRSLAGGLKIPPFPHHQPL